MLGLPLIFTAPLVLAALVALPALYLLLRVTPPRPRQVPFPPLRLVLAEKPVDETPARTPLWLLMLRLFIAGVIIMAMAGPIWNPPIGVAPGAGPLALLIDDGFASAPDWDLRIANAAERLADAGRAGHPVALTGLSQGGRDLVTTTAAQALDRLRAMRPVPFISDRSATVPAISSFMTAHPDAEIAWISDGLENGGARAFAESLSTLSGAHPAAVVAPAAIPLAVAGAENTPDSLIVTVLRADAQAASGGTLRAYDLKGLPVGDAPFAFTTGNTTQGVFTLPVELRNDIARVAIIGEASARRRDASRRALETPPRRCGERGQRRYGSATAEPQLFRRESLGALRRRPRDPNRFGRSHRVGARRKSLGADSRRCRPSRRGRA